ncbi:nucleotide exchange factor GrpE [Candidatus Phytoplasma phoenicium]|uniref:Protein GrpE n=1 Tax=Candidatus Phytoplasma phoenicium TaxID=198422 RepID=A0A0L0MII1_9MOLU|nr:nucleotide exchange factor GrpE [Candidatus Phytoplasma phoenicium]KND62507.1 protein GrpE (HSP-70 cofactor) [Candidatus Phytoplasma phoenicium]
MNKKEIKNTQTESKPSKNNKCENIKSCLFSKEENTKTKEVNKCCGCVKDNDNQNNNQEFVNNLKKDDEKVKIDLKNQEFKNNSEKSTCCGDQSELQSTHNQDTIKMEQLVQQLEKELKDKITTEKLKFQAEMDNFRKRFQKEKNLALKYSSMDLIRDILVPFEQLEKVLEMPAEDPLLQKFLSGFKMIQKQIKEILEKNGVKEIKTLGEPFNPEFHYAVEKISDHNQPNGINVLVLQKGFLYKDLVLKPSIVKINEWSENNNENK